MAASPLKLISINIEGHKHLDLVLPFLRRQEPDVVCLQEVYQPDFHGIAEALGMHGHFAPMTLIQLNKKTGPRLPWGVALLTHQPFRDMRERYYFGNRESVPINSDNADTIYKVLVSCVIKKDGADYCVGTTHFTWTPDGMPNANQRRDMPNFLAAAGERPEIIFCGDLNAPRGREMFAVVAAHYKDNIPPEYDSSIDGSIHRDGALQVMVDGLFSTPHYRTENVMLIPGISDHCAITAEVFKN